MLKWNDAGDFIRHDAPTLCSFGLTEAIAGFLVTDIGVSAAIAPAVAGSLVAAGTGAVAGGAVDAATGKPILPGVGEGALTGAAIGGLGPAIGGGLGIGAIGGDILAGAGAGALGGAIIPGAGSPLSGALTGGASGAVAGITSGLTSGTTGGTGGGATPTSGTGAGAGAAASAAPASIGGAPSAGAALSQDASAALGSAAGGGGAAGGGLPGTPGIGGPPGGGGSDMFALSGPSDAVSAGADNTVSISGLGTANPVTTPGSAVAPTPVSNPELGGATGFSPGGATETVSPGSSVGNLYNSIFGNQLDPVSAAAAINPAAPASAIGGSSAPSGIGGLLKSYGGPLIAAGGLGLDLLRGNTPVAGESQLNTEAGQLATQGQQLQGYLQSGTLPPGVQQSITSASDSAKAAIRSQYAAMGGGNTSAMEQDLARVDQTAATQGAQIATQLLSQGVSETGLSEQIYSSLMNQATQQNAQLGSAIGSLATSLAGTPTVLKLQSAA